MKKVFKYPMKLGQSTIAMPGGAQVLTAQIQNDVITLWAIVNERSPIENRNFVIVGAGHELPSDKMLAYVNTVQDLDGRLVWHVFEAL